MRSNRSKSRISRKGTFWVTSNTDRSKTEILLISLSEWEILVVLPDINHVCELKSVFRGGLCPRLAVFDNHQHQIIGIFYYY
jgi:hypothetical protein